MRHFAAFQVFPSDTLLGQISREALTKLAQRWSVTEYDKGQLIMGDAEMSSDVCFLLTGSARVAVFTESGRQVSFLQLSKGDVFGEFSAIDGAPRSASIEAYESCIAARMPAEVFRAVISDAPDLAMALLESLVLKLRDLTSKISDFNNMSADDRIRAEILRLAERHASGQDRFVVARPPTQVEIAAQIFSNRETVAREMGRMRNMGLIGRDGRNLRIESLARLRAYVSRGGSDASEGLRMTA